MVSVMLEVAVSKAALAVDAQHVAAAAAAAVALANRQKRSSAALNTIRRTTLTATIYCDIKMEEQKMQHLCQESLAHNLPNPPASALHLNPNTGAETPRKIQPQAPVQLSPTRAAFGAAAWTRPGPAPKATCAQKLPKPQKHSVAGGTVADTPRRPESKLGGQVPGPGNPGLAFLWGEPLRPDIRAF